MSRKFTWDKWDYDFDGMAYIIAQDQCPNREDVPGWIVKADRLDPEVLNSTCGEYLSTDNIKSGWCAFQVRTDWEYEDGRPKGGYVIAKQEEDTLRADGRRKPGWFPVWILRGGEWY